MISQKEIPLNELYDEYKTNRTDKNLDKLLKGVYKYSLIYLNYLKYDSIDYEIIANKSTFQFWKHLDRFDPKKASLKTWISNIISNAAKWEYQCNKENEIRFQPLSKDLNVKVHNEEPIILSEEQEYKIKLIKSKVSNLNEQHQQFFNQYWFEGMTREEIAKYHNIDRVKIRNELLKIRNQIRSMIKRNSDDPYEKHFKHTTCPICKISGPVHLINYHLKTKHKNEKLQSSRNRFKMERNQ